QKRHGTTDAASSTPSRTCSCARTFCSTQAASPSRCGSAASSNSSSETRLVTPASVPSTTSATGCCGSTAVALSKRAVGASSAAATPYRYQPGPSLGSGAAALTTSPSSSAARPSLPACGGAPRAV